MNLPHRPDREFGPRICEFTEGPPRLGPTRMAHNDDSIEDMCAALHAQGIFTTTGRCQCGGYVMTLGGHLYHFASQVLFGSFMSGIVVGLQVRSEQMS